jgi:hypothetical protein
VGTSGEATGDSRLIPDLDEATFMMLYERLRDSASWGRDDRRGALNNLTATRVAQAAKEIRSGRTVSLAAAVENEVSLDEPQSGAARQAFSKNQAPLVSRGKYYGHVVAVRAMLVDEDGRFYLQHPEVELHDDTSWVATNIRPEAGIDSIAFVAAGKRGKACFDNMVTQNQWGGFDKLPPNTRILESVQIKVS